MMPPGIVDYWSPGLWADSLPTKSDSCAKNMINYVGVFSEIHSGYNSFYNIRNKKVSPSTWSEGLLPHRVAQSAGAVEYTDCTSAEG